MVNRAVIGSLFGVCLLGNGFCGGAAEPTPPPAGQIPAVNITPLEWRLPAGSRLVGFNLQIGFRDELIVVRQVAPVFSIGDDETAATSLGGRGTMLYSSLAKPGFEVGAVELSADEFVEGIRPIYMRRVGDKLDTKDQYEGRWLGSATSKPAKRLGGDGRPILGIGWHYNDGLQIFDVIQTPPAKK